MSAKRRAIGLQLDALHAERRHRIDVGGDFQLARGVDLRGVEHPDAGPGGAKRDVGASEDIAARFCRGAVGGGDVDAKPPLHFFRELVDPRHAIVADIGHLGALERADHAGGGANDAGRAENGDPRARERGAELGLIGLLDYGEHARRRW